MPQSEVEKQSVDTEQKRLLWEDGLKMGLPLSDVMRYRLSGQLPDAIAATAEETMREFELGAAPFWCPRLPRNVAAQAVPEERLAEILSDAGQWLGSIGERATELVHDYGAGLLLEAEYFRSLFVGTEDALRDRRGRLDFELPRLFYDTLQTAATNVQQMPAAFDRLNGVRFVYELERTEGLGSKVLPVSTRMVMNELADPSGAVVVAFTEVVPDSAPLISSLIAQWFRMHDSIGGLPPSEALTLISAAVRAMRPERLKTTLQNSSSERFDRLLSAASSIPNIDQAAHQAQNHLKNVVEIYLEPWFEKQGSISASLPTHDVCIDFLHTVARLHALVKASSPSIPDKLGGVLADIEEYKVNRYSAEHPRAKVLKQTLSWFRGTFPIP